MGHLNNIVIVLLKLLVCHAECKAHFRMMGLCVSCFEKVLVFIHTFPSWTFGYNYHHEVWETHDFLQLTQTLTAICVHMYYYCSGSWLLH